MKRQNLNSMISLFPNTPNNKKDKNGSEALNENNLICIQNSKNHHAVKYVRPLDPTYGGNAML